MEFKPKDLYKKRKTEMAIKFIIRGDTGYYHFYLFIVFLNVKTTIMKKYILTLVLFTAAIATAYGQDGQSGQSVVLCESYDEFGTASGIFGTWNVDLDGGYVYIVYKQIYVINTSAMYLQIDKKSDYSEDYLAQKTLTLTPESGKNWLVYDYFFSEAGEYKISIIMDGNVAATAFTEIFVVDADSINLANGDTIINTFYYEDSYVTFCQDVTEGKMVGEAESFPLGESGSVTVTIYIGSDKPFKTDLFYIDVFEDIEEDFKDYDSYNITINPDWNFSFVKQTFTKKGTFVIDVFNADDIYVNTGEVVIY